MNILIFRHRSKKNIVNIRTYFFVGTHLYKIHILYTLNQTISKKRVNTIFMNFTKMCEFKSLYNKSWYYTVY